MPGSVVSAIMAATTSAQLRAAMLMGARLESGWNLQSVGDQGTSFGPFQIHLPAHPGVSQAQAMDAAWATAYMMPAYQNGVNKVPASMWGTNPAQAAALAAFYAERPANMYSTSNYMADWVFVQQALQGQDVGASAGFSPLGGAAAAAAGLGGGSATTTGAVFDSATWERDISDVLNYMWMGGIVLGGMVLMAVGTILLVKGEGNRMSANAAAGSATGDVSKAKVKVKHKGKVRLIHEVKKNDNTKSASTQQQGNARAIAQRTNASVRRTSVGQSATRATAIQSAGRPQRNVKVIES